MLGRECHNESVKLWEVIDPERVVFLHSRDKLGVLAEMVEAAAKTAGPLDKDSILEGLRLREESLSSRISERIAFPHLQLPAFGRMVVVVGRSDYGVHYDAGEDSQVRLVFLILGDANVPDEHLALLSDIAGTLRDDHLVESLLSADRPDDWVQSDRETVYPAVHLPPAPERETTASRRGRSTLAYLPSKWARSQKCEGPVVR